MSPVEFLAQVPENLLVIIAAAFAVTGAGLLLVDEWRTARRFPLAGFILGGVFGVFADQFWGGKLNILATLVGVVAGPNIVILLSKKHSASAILDKALGRKVPPPVEPTK